MSCGVCWNCANLKSFKKEGEIFWHYQCSKYPGYIMKSDDFNNLRDCFESSKKKKVKICRTSFDEKFFHELTERAMDSLNNLM